MQSTCFHALAYIALKKGIISNPEKYESSGTVKDSLTEFFSTVKGFSREVNQNDFYNKI